MKKRFEGGKGFDIPHTFLHGFKNKSNKNLSIKFIQSKNILISCHDFTDSPNAYGKFIFNDFYEWINYLGKFSYQNNRSDSIAANALFSPSGNLLKGELRGLYDHRKIKLEGYYETINQVQDSRLTDDLQNFGLSSSYQFMDGFEASADGLYDLKNSQMANISFGLGFSLRSWEYNFKQEYFKEEREKFSLSAIYNDECTRFIFSFENRYQNLGTSEPVKSLTFRVQLKPFAKVVFSQGSNQVTF